MLYFSRMKTLDLTESSNGFVVHYGGRINEVNATTLANSLIYLSNIVDLINQEFNPGFKVEIVLEAIGPGSFRGKLKLGAKKFKNIFGSSQESVG